MTEQVAHDIETVPSPPLPLLATDRLVIAERVNAS